MRYLVFIVICLLAWGCAPKPESNRFADRPIVYETETTLGRDSVVTVTLYRTDGRDARIESIRLGRNLSEQQADSLMLRFWRLADTYTRERGIR